MLTIDFLFQFERPPELEKHLKCIWVEHNNPFLRLGPFKFEVLHQDPEIAYIHDLVSKKQTDNVKELAKGKTKSTPYNTGGKQEGFSKLRTSKVMYMNELLVPEAEAMSRNVELATRFKLKSEQYASENYQVMNYGIGGKISAHVDSVGTIYGEKGDISSGEMTNTK